MRRAAIYKPMILIALGAAGAGLVLLALSTARRDAERDHYRDQLIELGGAYSDLAASYNEAVRRTAVTELLVDGQTLSVRVRTAAGVIKDVPVPFFDPAAAVYIDYVVIDGRLWIRRVFDENTPARDGILIDPALAEIDFDTAGVRVGRAVYRSLSEGRWVVTVTGSGALGLERSEAEPDLIAAPEVKDFEELLDGADRFVRDLTTGEIIRRLTGLK